MIIDINTMFGPLPAAAADLPVDDLLALMKQHNVRACCAMSTVGLLLDHNTGNAATRAACSSQSELVPVATVNPLAFYESEPAHTKLGAEGFKMVRFFPGAQGWQPFSAALTAVVGGFDAQPLPIMADVDGPGDPTRLARALPNLASPLILAGVDARTLSEAVALMRANASVYVETSNLLATGAIKHLVSCVGADRVLYGSGAPARPMASGLGLLKQSGLAEGERRQIEGANAARLLGIA